MLRHQCGRATKWLSRDVDPLSITEHDLKEICDRLNTTPRKCLGYKTPAEVFRQKLRADTWGGYDQRARKSRLGLSSQTGVSP